MMSILSGLAVTGAGLASLWYAKPHNGQVRWFATAPVLDWLVPVLILGTLAVGVSLVFSGIVS